MTITRRTLTKALAIGGLTGMVGESYAQVDKAEKPLPKPYRDVNVPGDRGNVIFFFDFTCPFCAKLHPYFSNWSRTVPRAIHASVMPIVNSSDAGKLREQIIAARCFFAAEDLSKGDQLDRFVSAVYENVASGQPYSAQSSWMRAVQVSGIDLIQFGRNIGASSQLDRIRSAAKQVLLYQLVATPSVAIDGKYVVIPDDVGGNQQNFFTLINGLASKIIIS